MSKRKLPAWFGEMTMRQWRAQKRHELRVARRALDVARVGCLVELPKEASLAIMRAHQMIDEAIKHCSVKNWGR